ncbi:MAG TPA: sugar-binding protein [Anaerolineales bacterium]|nr:sugar-binding protein [Anaerolineales bacterium]
MKIGRVFLAVLLCLLVACQSSSGLPAQKPLVTKAARRKITIAWIPKGLNNPVFEVGRAGAIAKAAELTAAGPVDVEVLYAGSVDSDGSEQVRVIDDVIARGVDGIAISCDDPTACIDPINRAVNAGIPVMTWDADSPLSKRFTFMGLDNIKAGHAGASMLVQAMGTRGKVAILTGVPGADNLEERIRGFKEGLAGYPDIQVIATVVTNDDINLGVQAVEDTMQAHPDIKGWYFAGMWPLFADRGSMPLWEDAALHRGMKTIAFDALPVELELLRDGYLSGLLDQKNWFWGYEAVQIIYDHIVNQKTYPYFVDLGYNIITKNNVDAMLQAWDTNDFTKPLPPP